MIALVFVVLVVVGIWWGVRSARRARAVRTVTWTAEPSARLRLRSARKGETL